MFLTIPKEVTLRGRNSGLQMRQFQLLSPTLFLVIFVLYRDMVLEFACRWIRMPEITGIVPMEETSKDGEHLTWKLSVIGFRKKGDSVIQTYGYLAV